MNLVLHQVKKDIRHLQILLIVWFVLILIQSALSISNLGMVSSDMALQVIFSVISLLVPVLQALLLIVVIPLLVQDEPLVGSTAFWFTRPLSRKTLLSSKSLFIVFLLILPPLLAEVIVLVSNGITLHHIMLAVPQIIMEKLSFMLPLLLLATVTRNFARFALTGVVAYIILMLLGLLFSFIALYTGKAMEKATNIPLLLSGVVISNIITIFSVVTLVIYQYLRRKTVRTIIAAGFIFVLVMVINQLCSWNFLKTKYVSLDEKNVEIENINFVVDSEKLSVRDEVKIQLGQKRNKTIHSKLDVSGALVGHFVDIKELKSIRIDFPEDESIVSSLVQKWYWNYPRGAKDALQHVLNEATLVNVSNLQYGLFTLMALEEDNYVKYKKEKGTYSAQASCILYKYDIVAVLPLESGTRYDKGSDHAVIVDVLRETAGCEIILRESSANMMFDRKKAKNNPGYVVMDNFKKIYILCNKKRGEAFLPEKNMKIDFISVLSWQKRLQVNTQRLRYSSINNKNEILPEINEEWLKDAELLYVEAVPIGEFSRQLSIEDFSF